jgi:hypothetical protein
MVRFKNFRRWLSIGVMASLSSACLYTNINSPSSYRSATPIDVKAASLDPIVQGSGCIYSALYLVSWGDGGYAGATKKALKNDPTSILYDVKADLKVTSYILGLWTRACTIVSGRAGHV